MAHFAARIPLIKSGNCEKCMSPRMLQLVPGVEEGRESAVRRLLTKR